jgi:hypothetical protein
MMDHRPQPGSAQAATVMPTASTKLAGSTVPLPAISWLLVARKICKLTSGNHTSRAPRAQRSAAVAWRRLAAAAEGDGRATPDCQTSPARLEGRVVWRTTTFVSYNT